MKTRALNSLIKTASDGSFYPTGALLYGGIGALLGTLFDEENAGRGALIGGILGALGGAGSDAYRYYSDKYGHHYGDKHGPEYVAPTTDTDSSGSEIDPDSEIGQRVSELSDRLRRFNETIQIPTKREFAGTGYDDSKWREYSPYTTVLFGDEYPGTAVAFTTPEDYVGENDKPVLHIREGKALDKEYEDLVMPTLAHEYSHWQNGDVDPDEKNKGSGRSPVEQQKLKEAYGFTDSDLGGTTAGSPVAEAGATNAELRAMIWQTLSDKLGRDATYDEFKNYIGNMDLNTFIDEIATKTDNIYFLNSLERSILNNDVYLRWLDKNLVPVKDAPLWHNVIPWTTGSEKKRDNAIEYNNELIRRKAEEFLRPYKKALLEVANSRDKHKARNRI